jgi:tetratricopeptide (TPR) repeat protein
MRRALAPLALLLLAPAGHADVPAVLVPAHVDTIGVRSESAPLLIPGQPNPADTLERTRARTGRDHYAVGRELEKTGHPAAAIAAYRNAVRLEPDLPDAHYRMGRLYTAVGEHRAAATEYAAEFKRHPDRVDAGRWLALELAQLGDTTACARLESLIRRDPRDEASWQALGFAYSLAGRSGDGERALRRALALDPGDADAWRDLGVALAARHRDREAYDAYRRAAKLDPHDVAVLVNLGNLELRRKHPQAALDAYREAASRDSSQVLAWRGQLTVLEELRRPEEAGAVYRRWLAVAPQNSALRMEAMKHFQSMGRGDIVLELARDGVRAAPRSGEARLALGMAYHENDNERAALSEMRDAQALFTRPGQRERIGGIVREMRARAPDSLRALFAADSAAHETASPPAAADSLGAPKLR